MPFLPIIILVFVIFFVLMFALRYVLTSNIRKATGHLDEMSREHAVKEADIERRVRESKEEAQKITAYAKKEAEDLRSQTIKEAYVLRDGIVKEAHQKSEDLITQTDKTCEILKREIEDRIAKGSLDKACSLLFNALPDDVRIRLHELWMEEIEKGELDMGHLKVPERIQEIKLVSAFPLTEKQKRVLNDKLVAKFGKDIPIAAEVDATLVAGLVITIGNAVIDGALRNRIQRQIERKS